MSFTATIMKVFIASPSDVDEERETVVKAIENWNSTFAERELKILLPVRWESGTTPDIGYPQDVIDNQLKIDECDILIGIFWKRIGTKTDKDVSGTVQEIHSFARTGKPLLLYFSERPFSQSEVDIEQLMQLHELKEEFKKANLISEFKNIYDLEKQIFQHLSKSVLNKSIKDETVKTINLTNQNEGIKPSYKHSNDIKAIISEPIFISYQENNKRILHANNMIESHEGFISFWIYIDEKGEGIRRDHNHYIISHCTSGGKTVNIDGKKGYPNTFAIGYIQNNWHLYLTNDKLNIKLYRFTENDNLQVGWHNFIVRWSHYLKKLHLFIDGNLENLSDSFFDFWPRESTDIYIGTWPNKQQAYYIETYIARLFILNEFIDDTWVKLEQTYLDTLNKFERK